MSLPEAIVYLLASTGYGMKTEQIAREINELRLYVRRDGQPVSDKQFYAVIMAHPFLKRKLTSYRSLIMT